MIREQVINYLTRADLIIGFNIQSDLRALDLTQMELALIENKIIDLDKYLSPRLQNPFALRFIAYLCFGISTFQDKVHIPVVDATITYYYLFLKYYDLIMLQYKSHMDKSYKNKIARLFQTFTYEGYKWPKNLLKKVKQPPEYDEETCYSVTLVLSKILNLSIRHCNND